MTVLSTEVRDPIVTLVRYVGSLPAITDLLPRDALSIYGDALPPEADMPNAALSFRAAGGLFTDSSIVIRPRVEVRAWGRTDQEAALLYWTLHANLHRAENIVVGDARILSILFDGGPAALIDQTLNTPFKLGFMNLWAQIADP